MGLADLKKKPISIDSTVTHTISIEDFISDAERYALGQLEYSAQLQGITKASEPCPATSHGKVTPLIKDKKSTYRHATFSLSETAIAQLAQMSEASNMAKSKLLREFIDREFQHREPSKK